MSLSAVVRKSGRIKTRKKAIHMSDDFEYDENKFEPDDESNVEIQANLSADISTDISALLNSHSKETNGEKFHLNDSSISNVADLFQTHGHEILGGSLSENFLSDGQLFSCEVCGKKLPDVASYNRHLKSHSSDRQFQCSYCEKSFIDSCNLKRHLKTHENDRPFSCEICHKSFRDTASISRHMLTHTERPRMFQCSMCDKDFTDKAGLKRHEKTHTGVRPFVCEVCQKSFLDSCSFKRHSKIHIGIKNFHCPRCKRSFMEKQSLVRHQKNVCKLFDNSSDLGQNGNLDGDLSNSNIDYHQVNQNKSNDQNVHVHDEDKSHSNHSYNTSLSAEANFNTSVSSNRLVNSRTTQKSKSSKKGQPSLGSLIKKDPGLYNSISEIVESIDSYEKMLDLCGDQGQKEIDAALTRDPVPMPDNLLCFECGELLVEDVNFKSEGKVFHPSMTNAFKCMNCEADDDEDDSEFGEPPVLMPHYSMDTEFNLVQNNNDTSQTENANQDSGNGTVSEKFYGTDESMEQFQDRLKTQHGVYFVGDNNDYQHGEVRDQGNCNETNGEDSNLVCTFVPLNPSSKRSKTNKSKRHQRTAQPDQVRRKKSTSRSADKNSSNYKANDPTIPSVFPCHLCTKVFASSPFLAQHLSLHKNSPHKCSICSKCFTGTPALKRHMRMHTGEKPYTCPLCQKQFRDPSNFGKHKKTCSLIPSGHPISGFATDWLPSPNMASSVLSVKNGEIQPAKKRNNGKGKGRRRRQQKKKVFVDNAAFPDPGEGSLPVVYLDIAESDLTQVEEEGYPIMAVIPSLDDLDGDDENAGVSLIPIGEGKGGDSRGRNYVVCQVCQKVCDNQDHLEMHMNYHTGNPNITCIECGKTFADSFGMKRHMRTHLGVRPYTCEYCNRGYCDNWTLKKHKSKGCMKTEVKIPVDLLHPCPKCVKVFCDEEKLQTHMKVHKGSVLKEFECDICQKRFSEAFNLKKHRRLHMAICSGCGQEFNNIQLLDVHQESGCKATPPTKDQTHGEEGKSFPCEDCGRVYSTKSYLDRHRKIHSGIKPHVCEICNKRFAEAFKLRRHKKMSHSDDKPFMCQDCGKCFTDDEALKRHAVSSACALNKVMGESISSEHCACQFCDKVFQKSYMLVRHMAVHSQSRPFACEICGRSYKDTSSLKRHQVTHKGVKGYVCPTCGTDFYYSDSLKRHMGGKCGKKTKGRKRKAASWTKPRKRYSQKTALANTVLDGIHNTIENGSNNTGDNASSWKTKLHTQPYTTATIPEPSTTFSCLHTKKKVKTEGKWSCRFKDHCWLCDVKTASPSALVAHRRFHNLNNRKRFSCSNCFYRLHKKVYWKAHVLACQGPIKQLRVQNRSSNNNNNNVRKATTTGETMQNSQPFFGTEVLGSVEVDGYEALSANAGDGKRPRRSVPRAKWSWISQI